MKTGTVASEFTRPHTKKKRNLKPVYAAINDEQKTTNRPGKWYQEIVDDPEEFSKLADEEIRAIKGEAKKFLDNETLLYSNKNPKGGGQFDYAWMRTVMNKGTASDKIAAYTILVQDSPVHNLGTLRNLINLVKVGKKNECLMVIDTLTDLFLMDLLPPHRKLKVFEARPHSLLLELSGNDKAKRQKCLFLWYFEDQLKELYMTFIQSLQNVSHDSVDKNKEKAVTAYYKLLAGNPEQEKVLLANIVNKLGDPSQKVVSKVIYNLTQLLHEHPNMKGVVTEEIEKLLFRPNVRQRAQYYGLCFLTQLLFTNDDTTLAVALVKLYFSFFKACVKKGDVDSRLMSALFTGVNRAYPFARNEINTIAEHIDTLYKVVHIASFNVSLHALCLLFHVTDHAGATSDRFYSALYKKLLDPQIGCSSHQAMFLNLLFRSLQKDTNNARVRAFVKRLLQLSLYWPVPLVCGVQYMISQLLNKQMNIVSLELLKLEPKFENDESDGEEHYDDVQEEDIESKVAPERIASLERKVTKGTWFHCQNERSENQKKISKYDPFHRNPSFSGGEHSVCTELEQLSNHYHPTVSLFAQKIMQGEKVFYSGDPLQDFSLSRFLERFVFKNPKKVSTNTSMQVHKLNYTPVGIKSLAVTSDNYLNIEESKIPVDELFLYRYLNKRRKEKITKNKESDVESVASEEFEEMIDNMMGVKKDEIDFAEEVEGKLQVSKKRGSSSDDGFETDEDQDSEITSNVDLDEDLGSEDTVGDGNDDIDAEEYDDDDTIKGIGEEDEFDMLDVDDDGEELIFDDSCDDDIDISNIQEEIKRKTSSLKNPKKHAGRLKEKGLDENTFLPAEKFAEILEDTGTLDPATGSISAMSNKENADMRQLKWESRRGMSLQEKNRKWKRKSHGNQFGNFSKKRRK